MEQQNCRDMKRLKRIIINHLLELHDTSESSSERHRIGKIETALDRFYGKRLHVEAYRLEDAIFEDLFDDYIGMLKSIARELQIRLDKKFYRASAQEVLSSAVEYAIWNGLVSSTFRTGNEQMHPLSPTGSGFYPALYAIARSQILGIASTLYWNLDDLGKRHPHLETTVVSYTDMQEGLKARAQSRKEYRIKVQEEANRLLEESFSKTPPMPSPYEGLPMDISHYIQQTLGTDPLAHELLSILPIKRTVSPHELVPSEEGVVEVMIENVPFMQQVIIHPSKEETQ